MSAGRCADRARLVELSAGTVAQTERTVLVEHLASCAACQGFWDHLSAGVDALRRTEPPPIDDERRRRQINRALAAAAVTPSPSWVRWSAFALGTGVALVLAFFVSRQMSAPADADLRLVAGTLESDGQPLSTGATLALDGRAVHVRSRGESSVALGDGSRVILADASRATLRRITTTAEGAPPHRGAGWRWDLEVGVLDHAVAPQDVGHSYVVETTLATVSVVGTSFRMGVDVQGVTEVNVEHGVVEVVARRSGERRRLGATESWRIEPSAPPPTHEPADVEPAPPQTSGPSQTHAETQARISPTVTREIRGQIESGKVESARALIHKTRALAQGQRAVLAELAILEAEAFLAERKIPQAIDAYLTVTRGFPSTAQAEDALFAAAQLSLDHPPARAQGLSLMERYLRDYPRGRFRQEAERAVAPSP